MGLLVVGLLLLVLFRCESPDRLTMRDDGGHAEIDRSEFGIEGDATQSISPGRTAPIDLTLTNPHDLTMTVSDLEVTVDEVTAPNADRAHPCTVEDFMVEQHVGDLPATVPAGTARSLSGLGVGQERWPRVGMVNRTHNQDGCKSAVVTLAFTGSGRLHH